MLSIVPTLQFSIGKLPERKFCGMDLSSLQKCLDQIIQIAINPIIYEKTDLFVKCHFHDLNKARVLQIYQFSF